MIEKIIRSMPTNWRDDIDSFKKPQVISRAAMGIKAVDKPAATP
jgi:hypothetical protein